ncbi:MAG: FG-GAP-like repeat-containing protein, partial [Calditrichia bacterium]
SADDMFTFSCALGDADGDGDLDLLAACGEPYSNVLDAIRIYYNEGGILDTLPGWISQTQFAALDADFADMDRNGYLDVIVASHHQPNAVFLADSAGQISEQPSWQSQDSDKYANSLTTALVDNNPFLDLMVSDNSQLGGIGKFKAYFFADSMLTDGLPAWMSYSGGYGSAVLAEDVNNDGETDLLAGRWWGAVRLYSGTDTSFNEIPDWQSNTSSVVEAFALRDLDQDGLRTTLLDSTISADSLHLLYLPDQRLERIVEVRVNQQILQPGADFTSVPAANWISFRQPLLSGDQLQIHYLYSVDRDLVVTNWGPGEGNFIFYNQTNPVSIADGELPLIRDFRVQVYPNPFNPSCRFQIDLKYGDHLLLQIFDLQGRLVKTVHKGNYRNTELSWDGNRRNGLPAASGMYIYRAAAQGRQQSGKLLLLK